VKLICAKHTHSDAVARCVACGDHLCSDCRTRIGVRNYCQSCRSGQRIAGFRHVSPDPVAVPASPAGQSIAADPSSAATISLKRPTLAAALSVVPGLGQAYAGSVLRGVGFFAAWQLTRDWNLLTPLLACFLYVFNLWDAYRLAASRNAVKQSGSVAKRDRFEEVAVTLAGLGLVGYTFLQLGGVAAADSSTVMPLAALAAGLLIAQETRN
jgi:hypothetical protein